MRNVSTAYKQLLYQNKRNYENTLLITLADGTELTVTNEHIMDSGFDIDDAVGEDNNFSALGSTIINSCDVTLYNNDEVYSDYDFANAKVIVKTNLVGADPSDELQLGEYTVDTPTYGESTINLTLLDNMCQFDREYDSYGIYTRSTTIYNVVLDACTKCGVLYDSSLTNMPNKNFIVASAPKDDTTYREVIGWCATIAGCFARCNSEGKLEFGWFDINAFDTEQANNTDGGIFDSASPYATGDNVNGGTFSPWSDTTSIDGGAFTERTGIHYIPTINSQNIAVDDVVITGIQITYDVETDSSNTSETQLRGTDDYIIAIKDNPFINADNYTDVLDFLAPQLIGLQFRACNISHPNDPTIEAGDVAYVWDTKGVQHRVLITRVDFNPTKLQTIVCGAESVGKNSSSRASAITKAIAKSRRQLNEEKALREQLAEDFQEQIANSSGLYFTRVSSGSSEIIYGHDKPLLADSKVVMKLSTAGLAMTGNYTGDDSTTTWYGQTFDGTWLANIISTMNLFFDYAHGGTIRLGGTGNGNGILEVYDKNNNLIGTINKNGADLTGIIKMLGDVSFATVGLTNVYMHTTVEGFIDTVRENFQYSIPYDDSGKLKAIKAFVEHGNEIEDVSATVSSRCLRMIALTTGSYLPEIKTSSDMSKVGGIYEVVSYSSSVGIQYRLYDFGGRATNRIEFLINGNTFRLRSGNNRLNPTTLTDGTHTLTWDSGYVGSIRFQYGTLRFDGNRIAFQSSSSRRYKHNIKQLSADRDAHKLLELPIVEFEWNDDHNLQYEDMRGQVIPGIIAEDVEEIYPSAVIYNENGEVESWDERRIIPGMLALIQEQDQKIKNQEAEIEELKSRLEKLEHAIMNIKR